MFFCNFVLNLVSFTSARYKNISLRDFSTEKGATIEITSGIPLKNSKIG